MSVAKAHRSPEHSTFSPAVSLPVAAESGRAQDAMTQHLEIDPEDVAPLRRWPWEKPGREHLWQKVLREAALHKQGGRCAYCRQPLSKAEITADHADPLSRGGRTKPSNIRAACDPCNQVKGSLTEYEFLRYLAGSLPFPRCWAFPYRVDMLLAQFRWRLWVRTERAEKRILRSVGLEN